MVKTLTKKLRLGRERRERIRAQYAMAPSRQAKRLSKSKKLKKSHNAALPKVGSARPSPTYRNPVNLSPPRGVVYLVTNRITGRKNYYSKKLIEQLAKRKLTNYQILLFDPKKAIFRNPMTRNPVYPRNLQRVKV
jgi:hypothetical protein